MGPKYADLNPTLPAKDGESFSSMKIIPESLENTVFPTQDNILKRYYSDEEKYIMKSSENQQSLQENQMASQTLLNLQEEYKLNNQQIKVDIDQRDIDKLLSELGEDNIILESEVRKKSRSRSSFHSSQYNVCSRNQNNSGQDFRQQRSNLSQMHINNLKNKEKRSRISTLNVTSCPSNFQQLQYLNDLQLAKRGVSSEKILYSKKDYRQQQLQQGKRRLFLQVQNQGINFKKSWVQILYYVGKMKRIMCQTTLFFRPHLLSLWQLKAINDVSSDFTKQQSQLQQAKKRNFSRIINKGFNAQITKRLIRKLYSKLNVINVIKYRLSNIFYKYLSKLPLYNPMNYYYYLWELIIFIAATINFIYIPIELSIQGQIIEFYYLFRHICFFILLIDIFVRANTNTSEEGSDRDIHQNILAKYISGRFIFDLISLLSLYNFFLPIKYLCLFFFVRIFYSSRIIDTIQEQFLLRMHTSGIISFSMLLLKALYFCHIFSCGFLKLGLYQIDYGKGWIIHYQLQNDSTWTQYLYSYYFSVITMTTIGYGDITAQSHIEKLFMIFFTIISCGIFGYTINSIGIILFPYSLPYKFTLFKNIGNILYDFNLQRQKFLQQLAQLNKYFKFFNVDIVLQSKARKYLEYINSEKFSNNSICSDSLLSLSNYLQTEIKLNSYKKVINRFQVFSRLFSEQFRDSLAVKMREVVLSPEQFIFEQGQKIEPAIYFINCGNIEIVSEKENIPKKIINSLKSGDIFGIEEFFAEAQEKPFSFKSSGVSSLLYFTHSDFQQVLKKYPDQVEIYCHLRDSIQFNSDYSKISKACFSCKQYTHPLNKCPYLFYGTNQYKIIQKYHKEIDKIISEFERKSNGKTNSLIVQEYVKAKAEEYLMYNQRQTYFSIKSNDFESDPDIQDDTFIMNKSNQKYTNLNTQSIPNQSIPEENSEFSQPNSLLKQPSQQQILQPQPIMNLLNIKDQFKNTIMVSIDSQKLELENTISPNNTNSAQFLNTKEQNDKFIYYSNTSNIIKTIDLDGDSIRKQLKPSSAIYLENIQQDDQSQVNISQKLEQSKLKSQLTNPNGFSQSQPNGISQNLNIFKLPLKSCNGNTKVSQKERLNSYEQLPITTSTTSMRKQFNKVESNFDQGGQNILYSIQNQNFQEIKELILHMFMYIQHQDLNGSIRKLDLKKKLLESNQQSNWNNKFLLLGDLDLDIMQNYKIYFPNSNLDKILLKMKLKSSLLHIRHNHISQNNSPLSPSVLQLQMRMKNN